MIGNTKLTVYRYYVFVQIDEVLYVAPYLIALYHYNVIIATVAGWWAQRNGLAQLALLACYYCTV